MKRVEVLVGETYTFLVDDEPKKLCGRISDTGFVGVQGNTILHTHS